MPASADYLPPIYVALPLVALMRVKVADAKTMDARLIQVKGTRPSADSNSGCPSRMP
jgi:hypothetical protein